jgi:hypothetical protein
VKKIFIRKCILFMVGSVCCVKQFTTESINSLKDVPKVADDAQPCGKVAETTVIRLIFCGFQCTGKAMGQAYQCWWRMCREISVVSRFNSHVFYIHL